MRLFVFCLSLFFLPTTTNTSTVLQIIVGCFSLRISKEQTTTHPKVLYRPVAWSHMMPLSIVATSRGIGCRSGRVGVRAVECACAQTWVKFGKNIPKNSHVLSACRLPWTGSLFIIDKITTMVLVEPIHKIAQAPLPGTVGLSFFFFFFFFWSSSSVEKREQEMELW